MLCKKTLLDSGKKAQKTNDSSIFSQLDQQGKHQLNHGQLQAHTFFHELYQFFCLFQLIVTKNVTSKDFKMETQKYNLNFHARVKLDTRCDRIASTF